MAETVRQLNEYMTGFPESAYFHDHDYTHLASKYFSHHASMEWEKLGETVADYYGGLHELPAEDRYFDIALSSTSGIYKSVVMAREYQREHFGHNLMVGVTTEDAHCSVAASLEDIDSPTFGTVLNEAGVEPPKGWGKWPEHVPLSEYGEVDLKALRKILRALLDIGKTVLLVLHYGTVKFHAFDDVEAASKIINEEALAANVDPERVWLHVDGACGSAYS